MKVTLDVRAKTSGKFIQGTVAAGSEVGFLK